jgi:hypothetical protein
VWLRCARKLEQKAITPSDIPTLHKLYCQLSGFDLRFNEDRERAWYEFIKEGYTADDLRLVLNRLRHEIKHKGRYPALMGFTRLIWGLDVFEQELAESKAIARNNPPKTNRQSVIKVFRPQVADATGPTVSCKPVSAIVPELIKKLREAAK